MHLWADLRRGCKIKNWNEEFRPRPLGACDIGLYNSIPLGGGELGGSALAKAGRRDPVEMRACPAEDELLDLTRRVRELWEKKAIICSFYLSIK